MMIKIRASLLGKLKMENFCPRCFWLSNRLPIKKAHTYYSPMPGIVSTIDSHIKHLVATFFSQKKDLPPWLKRVLNEMKVSDLFRPENWEVEIDKYILTGTPDILLRLSDNSYCIVDFKTAKLSKAQEDILPLYETQLNAYAYLANKKNLKVTNLALIYLEPQNCKDNSSVYQNTDTIKESFILHFECKIKKVEIWEFSKIENLVKKAGEILSQPKPPDSIADCQFCKGFIDWFKEVKKYI